MKRLFGENATDRGLLRQVVEIYARTKGIECEDAHQKLSSLSEIEGPFQEIAPDRLLRARLRVYHFKAGSDPDGAGFRGDDPPTVTAELDRLFGP